MSPKPANNELTALVKKYDRPGPRYTSYPTAPEWTDRYGPDDYIRALGKAARNTAEPLSFYLHVPFCHRRCWFCGCTTMTSQNADAANLYLDRVARETSLVAHHLGQRKTISQLHWGGGTPSFLTDSQTIRAFEIFSKNFSFTPAAEISIELDPRVTTRERILLLKSLGFNRLSFGVQDLDQAVQIAIGRNQSADDTISLYESCRKNGFTGINFDLIYGLPRQTEDSFEITLKRIIQLRPDRIALYSFAFLPQGKAHQRKIDIGEMPTTEQKLSLFMAARDIFLEAGYRQIGMDHFVLPADELAIAAARGKLRRNFMGYTVNAARDWIGLGMSSISYVSDNFAQNHSGIDGYNNAIDHNRLAIYRGLELSPDDLIRQYIISELMCNFRLDFDDLKELFSISPDDYLGTEMQLLDPFYNDGLLRKEENRLIITDIGKILVRNIAMTFDAYLKSDRPGKSKVQFSRTV